MHQISSGRNHSSDRGARPQNESPMHPDESRYLKLVHSQLHLVINFVDNLLTLRQLREEKLILTKTWFNPQEILDDLVSIFKP